MGGSGVEMGDGLAYELFWMGGKYQFGVSKFNSTFCPNNSG
jgi:hypothetical protein